MKQSVGGRGYGLDLRERIVAAVRAGHSNKTVARLYEVHPTTVGVYLEKERSGTLQQVGRSSGRPRRVTPVHEQQLLQQLEEHRDATLAEHARMLEEATGLRVSLKTVDRMFARLNITHKKNAGRQRAE